MELNPEILRQIDNRFEESDRETVRTLLANGCDSEAVCIAILRLSRGQVNRVEGLIEAAQRDYRDVIAWAAKPTRTYIVGLLRKGPQWSASDEGGKTHLDPKVLRKWKNDRAIFVGGWFTDLADPRGLYIFTVDSVAAAEALVQADAAIASGKLMFEFHPWLAPDGLKIASPEEL